MKVDIEILLSLYALMCVVSNIVNLAIELCKVNLPHLCFQIPAWQRS